MPVFNDLWLFSISIFSACSLEGWRIFRSVASEVSPGSLDGSHFAFPTLSVAPGAAPGTRDRQLRVPTSVQISFLEKKETKDFLGPTETLDCTQHLASFWCIAVNAARARSCTLGCREHPWVLLGVLRPRGTRNLSWRAFCSKEARVARELAFAWGLNSPRFSDLLKISLRKPAPVPEGRARALPAVLQAPLMSGNEPFVIARRPALRSQQPRLPLMCLHARECVR